MRKLYGAIAGLLLLSSARPAAAAGYDTPMLYSARHMGMGGAAAAYVDDPSALFHNPAGLARIKKISLMGDFSLLVGGIRSSPDPAATNLDSEPVVAPFFLVGGGVRILKWLTAGLAVYPVASASGAYKYSSAGTATENSTKLVFIEISPGVAANFDAIGLKLGAGYRFTTVSLARKQTFPGTRSIDFDMSGWNFASFRVGAQWDAPKWFKVGVTYRHKTTTKVTQDQVYVPWLIGGCAPGECTAKDGQAEFTLPGKLTFGLRGDFANFGAAVDLEYGLNSQNERTTLSGTKVGTPPCSDDPATPVNECALALDNVFLWDNAITLRVGGEYRIALGEKNRIIPRLGFVFDARTSQKEYPTAFGTPPGPTYVITAGAGFERGPYRANLAYGYRFGSATVTDKDLTASGTAHQSCPFCSYPGDYKITLNGIYVDFSYDFE